MNQDLNDMLETTPSTDELMDVDTSFLDAYRRGGSEELKRAQAHEAQQQTEAVAPDIDPEPEVETPPGPDAEKDTDIEPDDEPELGDDPRSGGSGQHGCGAAGAAGSSGGTVVNTPPQGAAADAAPRAQENDAAATAPRLPHAAHGDTTPALLRLTDHQEAVQNSTTAKGGSGGADDTTVLPQSGFRLGGVKSQPVIRALPDVAVNTLREQLRSAAVRELGVTDAAAREFSDRLSQVSLVMAFLLAQLDLGLDADASTRRAAELFRSRDPLLGSMVARLDGLERLEVEKRTALGALREELVTVRQTVAVIEQAIAYSIADRTENFLRGSHNIHDAPITHKDAIFIRDRVREATKKQTRFEREREGRPIR
ncbi:hypothetical protein [Saccharopolyspora hattusasensis]|uniref:hypothetical protein n=1 Tax=Saccharopolyspora hattusasensis TaxID=1128679 RepID=UPI003D969AF7